MRALLLAVLALTACGPDGRDLVADGGPGADAATSDASTCAPLGSGWVLLGGRAVNQALDDPSGNFSVPRLAHARVPTVAYGVGDSLRVAELGPTGWSQLGESLEYSGISRSGDLVRDGEHVVVPISVAGVDENALELYRWDGAGWASVAQRLDDVSVQHVWPRSTGFFTPTIVRSTGAVLVALRDSPSVPVSDAPWTPGILRVSTAQDGVVSRTDLASSAWGPPPFREVFPLGLFETAQGAILVAVGSADGAAWSTAVFRELAGGWQEVAAGAQPGLGVGAAVTLQGEVIAVMEDGAAWVTDGTTWRALPRLPTEGEVLRLRSTLDAQGQTVVGWTEWAWPMPARAHLMRWTGDSWVPLTPTDTALPSPPTAFPEAMQLDDCGRPIVLLALPNPENTKGDLEVWRWEGAITPID